MPRIMLVDDDYDALFTFKYVLESYNYEVDGFTDPILALKTFSGGLYDLIVIDIRMPTISGFELYKLLKRMDAEANICFITAGEIQYEGCHDMSCEIDSYRFLRKPISNAELLDYSAAMIKNSQKLGNFCVN
jgi:DNA-binding response OmpR family regulator